MLYDSLHYTLYYRVCTLEVLIYTSSVGFCIVARFNYDGQCEGLYERDE